MDWGTQLHMLGEVTLAIVLSGLIGLERELAGRPAGFRTQMLAGSAALLVGLGEVLLERFSAGGETAGEVMFVRTGALTHQMFRRLSNMNCAYF